MRALSLPALALMAACAETAAPPAAVVVPTPGVAIDADKLAAFAPLPTAVASPTNPATPEKVALGRMLYFETRLSRSGTLSCNSCHALDGFGVDGQPTSPGHAGERGGRNSPTVYNAAAHVAQFWDGRAPDVEAQAKGPILNPIEMGMADEAAVVAVLQGIPEYREAFAAAFPGEADPVTYDNLARAIGAFERGLLTPSRWDRFLAGDANALSDDEKKGFLVFAETGCGACHAGALVGGQGYFKLGQVNPWPDARDEGRFAVTRAEADKGVFKVPSLRNVAKTGPWFHDGSVATLDDAVRKMAHHQLGKELDDAQVRAIVGWLDTLTGELPKAYIVRPALPGEGAAPASPG